MKGYALKHNITSGEMESFFEVALKNNGHLISTNEKMRLGIQPSGMSPSADMDTGGASYAFTRITKNLTAEGIYFKVRNLRRMDAISYNSDMYGDVGGSAGQNVVRNNRAKGVTDWKKFSGSGGNETIFKNGLSLIEEVERVVAGSEIARDRIIAAYRAAGIDQFPDGRSLEEVIVSQ
tara:strand:- start:169 stop:702 length:534 start_codon:yes stop_codon:yes gene_type:complete